MDKITLGFLWTVVAGTAAAMIWIFTTFAKAAEVEKKFSAIEVQIAYGQYYERLDDFERATKKGNVDLAKEYQREMERLRAIICESEPKWERCES